MVKREVQKIDTVEKAKADALNVWEAHTNQLDDDVRDALDRCSLEDLHYLATLAIRAGVYRDASLRLTRVKAWPEFCKEAHRAQQLLIDEVHQVQRKPLIYATPAKELARTPD